MQAFYDGLQPLFSPVPAYWDVTLNLGFFVTEAFLDLLRMAARMWYSTHGQARGVIESLRDYVVHTGFDYQIISAKHEEAEESLVKKAQKIIDCFLSKNKWFERELDDYTRLHRDGEAPVRLFPQEDGCTLARTVEPWQIRQPGKQDPTSLFGVLTEQEDREQVKAYYVTMTGTIGDGSYIPADRMALLKANTDLAVKRGVSDFLATQALWEQGRKLLTCGLTGEAVRQAIAYVEEYSGAPQAAVQSLADALSDVPGGTSVNVAGTPAPPQVQAVDAGTIARVDKALQMKQPPVGNAENAKTMLTACYQALSVYYRVPEWMISGFSDANFAQALVQESPLVRRCQTEQKLIQSHYKHVLRLVLQIAEDQDLLPEGACDQLDFNVEATPLVVRDAKAETDRHKILHDDGLMSKRSWATAEDLDFDAEQEQREKDGDEPPEMDLGANVNPERSNTPAAEYKRQTDAT